MDTDEFAREAEACTELMYRVAHTILRSDADCQDAAQEALLKAWASRHTLREERYFRTWLTRILINTCHDMLKKRRNILPLADVPETGQSAPDPTLADALQRLPEKFRLPLTLCYAEGMTHGEISRALRIPVTTVQSRLRRGKEQLRKELNEDEA